MSCINSQILCKVSFAGLFNRSLFVFVGLFCKSLFVYLPVSCTVSCVTSPTRRRINTALNRSLFVFVGLFCKSLFVYLPVSQYGVGSDADCNWRLVVCTRMKRVTHEWGVSSINTALDQMLIATGDSVHTNEASHT